MGSDDLFHKRKKQTRESLSRRPPNREPYRIIRIFCEGEKTEPLYFQEICNELKLSNVKILGKGLDPASIVNQALDYLRMEKCDTAYCVFDQDEHSTYRNALSKIKENKINGINILAITSVPCFEYWILLHYKRTSRSYKRSGAKSTGDQLISAVKKYIPLYRKGCRDIYKKTKPYLSTAITNAK